MAILLWLLSAAGGIRSLYNSATMRPAQPTSDPPRRLSGGRCGRAMAAVTSVLMLSSCGTLALGTYHDYVITSEPAAATALFSNSKRCITPCQLRLARKKPLNVRLYKDCYEVAELELRPQLSAHGKKFAAFNMVMIGGFVMAGIDKLSGALMELTPQGYSEVRLRPQADGRCEPLQLHRPLVPREPREARHCCGPRHRI